MLLISAFKGGTIQLDHERIVAERPVLQMIQSERPTYLHGTHNRDLQKPQEDTDSEQEPYGQTGTNEHGYLRWYQVSGITICSPTVAYSNKQGPMNSNMGFILLTTS